MKRFLRNNSLSIVIFAIFFGTLVGMSVVGWKNNNEELKSHGEQTQQYVSYLTSGEFIEGVFENWESEFLQMWALVVLTVFLRQKGADESKPLRGSIPQETRPRFMLRHADSWQTAMRAMRHFLYAHSLGIALLLLFIISFFMHAAGGASAFNEEAKHHNESQRVTTLSYIGTSKFWYESLQNWQSEFFAVGSLMLLSIKLRERGSPESKPVGVRYDTKTGN